MLRLVSDADVHGDVIDGLRLREPTLDLLRVQDLGLRTADDPTILAWAANAGRVLLTRDRQTMSGHAYDRVKIGLAMPGVVITTDRMSIGDTIEEVLTVAICYEPDDMKDRVLFLPLR